MGYAAWEDLTSCPPSLRGKGGRMRGIDDIDAELTTSEVTGPSPSPPPDQHARPKTKRPFAIVPPSPVGKGDRGLGPPLDPPQHLDHPAAALEARRRVGLDAEGHVGSAGLVEGVEALGQVFGRRADRRTKLRRRGLAGRGQGDVGAGGVGERRRVAAGRAAGGVDAGEALDHALGAREPGRVVSIGVAGDETEHARLRGADPDRRALWPRAAGPQLAFPGLIVLSLEVDVTLAQERDDDLERL